MKTLGKLVAVVGLLCLTGCFNLAPPQWLHPGDAPSQRKRAVRFDPYPENETGPKMVGTRPREFADPLAEPARSRYSQCQCAHNGVPSVRPHLSFPQAFRGNPLWSRSGSRLGDCLNDKQYGRSRTYTAHLSTNERLCQKMRVQNAYRQIVSQEGDRLFFWRPGNGTRRTSGLCSLGSRTRSLPTTTVTTWLASSRR